MISEFNSKFIKYLCLLVFLQACAYFNTFYNAEEHYNNAEKLRIQSLGSSLPAKAIQEYGKAIEKSDKVLTEYSDSDYVKDAMLVKGKSHFFRKEYDSAREVFFELQESKENFLSTKQNIGWHCVNGKILSLSQQLTISKTCFLVQIQLNCSHVFI